jgi:hypothetical protein
MFLVFLFKDLLEADWLLSLLRRWRIALTVSGNIEPIGKALKALSLEEIRRLARVDLS